MIVTYLISGLAYFSLGLASWVEARHASKIPLSKQLPWLGLYGLTQSIVSWSDAFLLHRSGDELYQVMVWIHAILVPLSGLLLVRFGIGLIKEAGPLPEWLSLIPVVFMVPLGLLISFALIMLVTEPPLYLEAEVWSCYLLCFPGNLLAAFGFFRQWRGLNHALVRNSRWLLVSAAIFFLINAFVSGLFVVDAPIGMVDWLNSEWLFAYTGLPVQVWRMVSAVGVTLFVILAMDVFEAERRQQLAKMDEERNRAQLEVLEAHSEARRIAEQWTEALVTTSRSIADLVKVDDILHTIIEMARRLLNSDIAVLGLFDETQKELSIKCYANASGVFPFNSHSVENARLLEIVRSCCPHIYTYKQDKWRWYCPIGKREVQSAAIVPLKLEGASVGSLWIVRFAFEAYTTNELSGLQRLADQAVIAIEHATMAARLQSLATLEERSRIAREMHDGLAQVLGYLNLEMQTIESLAKQNNRENLLTEIKQIRQNVQQAQADVRENILCLRTTLSGETGIIPALKAYLHEFCVQTGIEAQLVSEPRESLNLPPLTETQMVRIIQEALTNVRKHAHAQHVWVQLDSFQDCLSVSIVDDGVGFNKIPGQGHFGLMTMRERAESVGGGLTVTSTPAQGTKVDLWFPYLDA